MTAPDPVLLQEIHAQPEAARSTLASLRTKNIRLGDVFEPGRRHRVMLTGSGTSRHAAETAAHWYRDRHRIGAEVIPTADVTGFPAPALVAVTQSGGTGSVVRVLRLAGEKGATRIVVTNQEESEAARNADFLFVTRAGEERAVPATKSFTTALLALYRIGIELAVAARARDLEETGRELRTTDAAVAAMEAALGEEARIREFVGRAGAAGPWFFLGGGLLAPLAAEGALKMMETACIPAVAAPAAELAHGPLALVTPNTPVVVLSSGGAASPGETLSLRVAAEAGAPVLHFAPDGSGTSSDADAVGKENANVLRIRHRASEALAPFAAAPILQLLAFYAGRALGRDVDRPPGLRKSVTDD